MKHINKYRVTKKFCLMNDHVGNLAVLIPWATARNERVVAVAHDADPVHPSRYTLRTSRRGLSAPRTGEALITDYVVDVNYGGRVEIVEADAVACASGPLPTTATVASW